MVDYDEIDRELGVEEEKVEKMAKYKGSPGGRLDLPHIGESVTITVTSEPYLVENPKLPKERARFIRAEVSGIEYDVPLSKTIWQGIRACMKRHGFKDLVGRTFTILGKPWIEGSELYGAGKCQCDKCKGRVKTYAIVYKGVSSRTGEVETVEL